MEAPAGRSRARPRVWRAPPVVALAGAFAAFGLSGCSMSASSPAQGQDGGGPADGGTDAGADMGSKDGGSSQGGAGGRASGGKGGQSGAAGAGMPGGLGGSASGAGGANGAGGGGVPGLCFVQIEVVNPTPTSAFIDVGPDVRIHLRARVFNSKSAAPQVGWTVTSPTNELLATTPEPANPDDEVSFPATTAGSYRILAQVTDQPECIVGTRTFTGVRPAATFTMRVTAADFPVTEESIKPTSSQLDVQLDRGGLFRIEPHATGQPVVMPAYLQITSPPSAVTVEGFTSHGALSTRLLPNRSYDLLIVPADPSYAPDLLTGVNPSIWAAPFPVDPGKPVVGLVLGPDGLPLEGARMLLKSGSRPSTIGTSDASGMLSLTTRPGVMSALVVPPASSGLPQVTVAGVSLAEGTGSLSVTTLFQPIALGPLTLTIVDPAGAKPVSGARVRIVSQADLTAAAILTVRATGEPDNTQLTAAGSVNAEVLSDAAGRAAFGRVPTGKYDVLVIPPSGSNPQALTSSAVDLQAAGVVPTSAATITMITKIALSGNLMPMPDAAGASITAVDTGTDVTGGGASTVADGKGGFTLSVSPGRSYRIIAQPLPGGASVRTVFAVNTAGGGANATPMTPAALMLPLQRGRAVNGTVESEGSPVGGAFIQIFCLSSAPSCVDPTISLAETTTRGDGAFGLLIPDPDATP